MSNIHLPVCLFEAMVWRDVCCPSSSPSLQRHVMKLYFLACSDVACAWATKLKYSLGGRLHLLSFSLYVRHRSLCLTVWVCACHGRCVEIRWEPWVLVFVFYFIWYKISHLTVCARLADPWASWNSLSPHPPLSFRCRNSWITDMCYHAQNVTESRHPNSGLYTYTNV